MPALICGSVAYDTIMVFPEPFRKHILPDRVHLLNVSFTVPEMRREFGGVAGNIAWSLRLLGGTPYPMATVGEDFGPYREHFETHGISTRYVRVLPGEFTPQAFITTDIEDNQITAFHPGAMRHAHLNCVEDAEGIRIGVVAPDGRQAMVQHSRDFARLGIPHLFDPGQNLILFERDELHTFIDAAHWIVTNDYEYHLLQERTGLDGDAIARQVEALVVTRGAEGSEIITREGSTHIDATRAGDILDPTGCGDAYRAGMLYGLLNDFDLPTACRVGSVLGAIKISHQGAQNHNPGAAEIEQRFFEAYGYRY